ncbi:g12578 [Coccomyxa viridis]|uniref:G12578 protein n=1 Tax=Coccomyxa viridis TaxID=1274662 RepID=A0ABP1GBQ4_9CHLO
MYSGLQLAAVTLFAVLVIGQPALGANRRLLSDLDTTSPVQLESVPSEEAFTAEHGRILQQVTGSGSRGAVAATSGRGFAAGESTNSAQPLSSTSGLRSTTGSSSSLGGTLGNAGTKPGQVSIDSTSSDAANVNSMRGVTNNAGVIGGGQRAEGTVSADVMPSSTNQGGGIRPSQAASSNLAMETMPESGSAMSMRSLP